MPPVKRQVNHGSTGTSSRGGKSAKKQKFQEESDEDDYDKEDLEVGGRNRKNVDLDGYASDSSQGSDFGGSRSRRRKRRGEEEGGDDDNDKRKATKEGGNDDDGDDENYYYAPDDKNEQNRMMDGIDDQDEDEDTMEHRDFGLELRKGAPKKNAKAYLELDDIEGQHFRKKDSDDDDDDDDDVDNEDMINENDDANDDDAPRARKKEGMGFVIEEFNMKQEMEEGRFTGEGVYTRNKADEFASHDTWLDGVSSKSAIKATKQAIERAENLRRDRTSKEENPWDKLSKVDCIKEILNSALLGREETIMQALGRMGEKKKRWLKQHKLEQKKQNTSKKKPKSKENKNEEEKEKEETGNMDIDEPVSNTNLNTTTTTAWTAKLQNLTSKIEKLSSLAANLFEKYGETDIYQESWINMVKDLRMDGEVARGWEPERTADDEKDDDVEAEEEGNGTKNNEKRSLISRPLISRPENSEPPPQQQQQAKEQPSQTSPKFFYYRWSEVSGAPPAEREKSYGPFSYSDMDSWVKGNYFGGADAPNIQVSILQKNSSATSSSAPNGPWISWNQALTAS